jgi:hypothetical protein
MWLELTVGRFSDRRQVTPVRRALDGRGQGAWETVSLKAAIKPDIYGDTNLLDPFPIS